MSKLQNKQGEDLGTSGESKGRSGEFWGKVGLTAASALLGGIAVALFNRKTLQNIQQKLKHTPPPPSNDDIY